MLRVERINKSYAGRVVVDEVSFEVGPGEVLGLLGPNGAGKSTSISIIAGIVSPDSGHVSICGRHGADDPRSRAMLGVAPQSLALYPDLTCTENLCFFGSLYGLRGTRVRERASALLSTVGLGDRSGARVGVLSGGMQRRLNLAAALMYEPRVLLLDEPTAGVDPHSRGMMLDLVRSLRDDGMAVLYTTHYMDEAEWVCDRVAVMDGGRILAIGTVDELVERHGGQTIVRVTQSEGVVQAVQTSDPRATVLELLSDHAATGLRVDRPDLEAVFFGLTGRSLRDG